MFSLAVCCRESLMYAPGRAAVLRTNVGCAGRPFYVGACADRTQHRCCLVSASARRSLGALVRLVSATGGRSCTAGGVRCSLPASLRRTCWPQMQTIAGGWSTRLPAGTNDGACRSRCRRRCTRRRGHGRAAGAASRAALDGLSRTRGSREHTRLCAHFEIRGGDGCPATLLERRRTHGGHSSSLGVGTRQRKGHGCWAVDSTALARQPCRHEADTRGGMQERLNLRLHLQHTASAATTIGRPPPAASLPLHASSAHLPPIYRSRRSPSAAPIPRRSAHREGRAPSRSPSKASPKSHHRLTQVKPCLPALGAFQFSVCSCLSLLSRVLLATGISH